MIDITKYINESYSSTTLYFNNLSALLLFDAEISGQISDGYWENATPYSHWKWTIRPEIIYDKNIEPHYNGPIHRKRYSLTWMSQYVRKGKTDKDYSWTVRFLNYGRFGRIYPESKWKDLLDNNLQNIVECLPEEKVTMEELEKYVSGKSWMEKYWDAGKKYFDDELLKKYYSTTYTRDDLEEDLDSAEASINTLM